MRENQGMFFVIPPKLKFIDIVKLYNTVVLTIVNSVFDIQNIRPPTTIGEPDAKFAAFNTFLSPTIYIARLTALFYKLRRI